MLTNISSFTVLHHEGLFVENRAIVPMGVADYNYKLEVNKRDSLLSSHPCHH